MACTCHIINRASSLLLTVACRHFLEYECIRCQSGRLPVIYVQQLLPSPRRPPTDHCAKLPVLYHNAGYFVSRCNPLTGVGTRMAVQLACQSVCIHASAMHVRCMLLRRHATLSPSTAVHMRRRCRISWNHWTETTSGRCRRSRTAAAQLHVTRRATKPTSRAGAPGKLACNSRQSHASNQSHGTTSGCGVPASAIQPAINCKADDADAWQAGMVLADVLSADSPTLHL